MRFNQVSRRSMYAMPEMRSVIQKSHRNPHLLPDGWKQFFYFLDEYLDTMRNDNWIVRLFLVEDTARCPMKLLRAIKKVVEARKSADRLEYWKVAAAMARQPVDRSAAYLAVACLDFVEPMTNDLQEALIAECPVSWDGLLQPDGNEEARRWFCACMALLYKETRSVPRAYPMEPSTALRLAAALTHLIAWDSRHRELRLTKTGVESCIQHALLKAATRPMALGMVVALDWMLLARDTLTLDPKAGEYVEMYTELALVGGSMQSAKLDLFAMNALLVLMGRFPDEAVTSYTADLPCSPDEVPTEPRAYAMPAFAEDRHTSRGLHLADTTTLLKKHCAKQGIPIPVNVGYSHGPPSHATKQGFEEFIQHIGLCEEQTSDGKPPLFKDEALRVYRSALSGVPRKRMAITETKLRLPAKPKSGPVKRKTESPAVETKRRCTHWVQARASGGPDSSLTWREMTSGHPMGQKPAGKKPPVIINADRREVFKGPFTNVAQAIRGACLTRVAREVLGLADCIPEQRVVVTADKEIGLVSPMIGRSGDLSGEGVVSDNNDRGLCKLHHYGEDWLETLTNPVDLLRIVVAKNLVGSSDNNTSNILIELDTKCVYGVDVGGWSTKILQPGSATMQWAFSHSPSKHLSECMMALTKRYAGDMVRWLQSLLSTETLQRWQEVEVEYPVAEPVAKFVHRVNLFLDFFNTLK